MLVRSDDRPIDEVDAPVHLPGFVRLLLDGREDPIPDPSLPPAPESAVHRRPRAVPLRQVSPRRPGPFAPQDAIDDPSMVGIRPTPLRLLGWEQRLEPLPLLVGQLSSVAHADC